MSWSVWRVITEPQNKDISFVSKILAGYNVHRKKDKITSSNYSLLSNGSISSEKQKISEHNLRSYGGNFNDVGVRTFRRHVYCRESLVYDARQAIYHDVGRKDNREDYHAVASETFKTRSKYAPDIIENGWADFVADILKHSAMPKPISRKFAVCGPTKKTVTFGLNSVAGHFTHYTIFSLMVWLIRHSTVAIDGRKKRFRTYREIIEKLRDDLLKAREGRHSTINGNSYSFLLYNILHYCNVFISKNFNLPEFGDNNYRSNGPVSFLKTNMSLIIGFLRSNKTPKATIEKIYELCGGDIHFSWLAPRISGEFYNAITERLKLNDTNEV